MASCRHISGCTELPDSAADQALALAALLTVFPVSPRRRHHVEALRHW
jgi:hypothetical protein